MSFETIGKYEIRGRLGAGAMGTVLDAFDPVIERRSALKVIPKPDPQDAEGQEALARFKREAQAAGRLNHPNIVAVHDYGEDAERAWIAMELVEGGTLKQVLDRGERLPLAETLRVMGQMLAGLDYSHRRGVVHRDIKPANLMLTPDGQVKIADFGIARVENSSMTQVGTVMGTPAYMAPEQLRGETVDARADIWASGVLLYQLLTGEKPFEGGYSSVMHKAINTEPTPPSVLAVTCPRGLDAVITKALAKRPEDRFASAAAFAEAILRAAAPPAEAAPDATVVTRPVAAPAPPPAAARTGPPVLLIGGAVALLVAAGAGFLLLGGPPAAPPASPGAGSTPSTQVASPPATPPPAASGPAQASLPAPSFAAPTGALPPPHIALTPASPPPRAPTPQSLAPQPTLPQPSALPASPLAAIPAPAPGQGPAIWAGRAAALVPPCSLVARSVTETGFALEGVLPRGGEAGLREALAASDIPPQASRLTLQEFDGPYCPALDVLRPMLAEAGLAPRIAVQGPTPLRAGDLLRFQVTMPDWPAHLYVAYFMKSGEVAHLVPSATHPAGTTVRLGEPRAGFPGWEVSEPFGTDLLVAVASEGPLFGGARPLVESQEAYLAALREALQASREAGRRVMIRPAVIETIAR
jgi:eukaryotic-like serine/threonine-protein kinase